MTGAIVSATGLMYVRLWIIAALFMWDVALELLPIMLGLSVFAFVLAFIYIQVENRNGEHKSVDTSSVQNPLELKVAFIFAGLFVLMAVVTEFVMNNYGDTGVRYFSALVGFTDIDPFVLSILNGHFNVQTSVVAGAILIAAGSNNLLKATYALVWSEPKAGRYSAFWLAVLGVVSIAVGWQL